jgi:hypothetical protein
MPWCTIRRFFFVAIWMLFCSAEADLLAQSQNGSRFRQLAPGIVTVIQPDVEESETVSGPREMVELVRGFPKLDWTPNFSPKTDTLLARASSVVFRREIWALEFGFKPIRMIEVDGKQVLYLVYYVKNNGGHKNPTSTKDALGRDSFTNQPVDHTIRFFPTFVLESHELNVAYLDSVMPKAIARIRRREDPNRTFYGSVSIASVPIEVSTPEDDRSVWGIATWTDVDPRTDFFSIYVRGLTNAYRWQDPEGAYQPGDPPATGRRFSYKTLQLNFWRPGDAIDPDEREYRYGLPTEAQLPPGKTEDELLKIYRLEERVDHRWIYR